MIFQPKTLRSYWYIREVCDSLHRSLDGTCAWRSSVIEDLDSRTAYKQMFGRCQGLCFNSKYNADKMLESLLAAKDGLRYATPRYTFSYQAWKTDAPKYHAMAVDDAIEIVSCLRSKYLLHE